jgi:hypothetical protein
MIPQQLSRKRPGGGHTIEHLHLSLGTCPLVLGLPCIIEDLR